MKSVARVIINSPVKNLDRLFDYNIPAFLADKVAPGVRVEVPFGFGNRKKEAYVMELADETSAQNIKDIIRVLDAAPLVDGFGLELIEFIRNTYFCTYNEAIKLLVPPGTGMKYEEYATLIRKGRRRRAGEKFDEPGGGAKRPLRFGRRFVPCCAAKPGGAQREKHPAGFGKKGAGANWACGAPGGSGKNRNAGFNLLRGGPRRFMRRAGPPAPKQAEIIDFLAGCDRISVADLCMVLNCSKPSVDALVKKGYLCYETAQVRRNPFSQKDAPQTEK